MAFKKRITEIKQGRKWIEIDFADNPDYINMMLSGELLELYIYGSKLYKKAVRKGNELFVYCNMKVSGKGRNPIRFRYTY